MKFIVFEGLDGAGKSTLMKKVEGFLSTQSQKSIFVRDPGTTSLGEKLRQLILDPNEKPIPKTEILMYQAARAQLVGEIIKPKLQKGEWVLSDRFYSSTLAFQGQARGLERDDIHWLNNFASAGLKPDAVVFIDIPVEESQRRLNKRETASGESKDRMELEDSGFHGRVREGYLRQAREDADRWLVLDGMRTPDELLQDVISYFKGKQWLD